MDAMLSLPFDSRPSLQICNRHVYCPLGRLWGLHCVQFGCTASILCVLVCLLGMEGRQVTLTINPLNLMTVHTLQMSNSGRKYLVLRGQTCSSPPFLCVDGGEEQVWPRETREYSLILYDFMSQLHMLHGQRDWNTAVTSLGYRTFQSRSSPAVYKTAEHSCK